MGRLICQFPTGAPCSRMQKCKRNQAAMRGDTVKHFDNWNDECAGFLRDDTDAEREEDRIADLRELRKDLNL